MMSPQKQLLLLSLGLGALCEIATQISDQVEVAFVPTAGDPYSDRWWVEADRRKLLSYGFTVTEVDLKGESIESLRRAFSSADVLFITGGNTFYLMEQVRASGLDQLLPHLLERGVLYAGASAGAVILGPDIAPFAEFDDPEAAPQLSSTSGLGLVDFVLIPHYNEEKVRSAADHLVERDGGLEFRTLRDDQAILVGHDGSSMVISSP